MGWRRTRFVIWSQLISVPTRVRESLVSTSTFSTSCQNVVSLTPAEAQITYCLHSVGVTFGRSPFGHYFSPFKIAGHRSVNEWTGDGRFVQYEALKNAHGMNRDCFALCCCARAIVDESSWVSFDSSAIRPMMGTSGHYATYHETASCKPYYDHRSYYEPDSSVDHKCAFYFRLSDL